MSIKNKKILFISRTLSGGGAERFISTFASYLADNDYNVELLLYEKSTKDYPTSDKLKINVMPPVSTSAISKINRIFDMKKQIALINPEYIIPFVDTVVICAFLANIFTRRKFILTVRVSPWHEDLTSSKFASYMRKVVAKGADSIMLQNKEQREYFPSSYLKKEHIVPNPIPGKYENISKINYETKYSSIVMTGRLDAQKNIKLAINAISDIRNEFPDVRLHIYGEGVQKDSINAFIEERSLNNMCFLEGRTDKIDEVLQNADMYLMTSDYEGMPNSLMEAMAMGVPCISSNCKTGPKDLITENKTGLLFKVSDKDDLAEKLKWALKNTDKMNTMGTMARSYICTNYSLGNTLEAFEKMMENT